MLTSSSASEALSLTVLAPYCSRSSEEGVSVDSCSKDTRKEADTPGFIPMSAAHYAEKKHVGGSSQGTLQKTYQKTVSINHLLERCSARILISLSPSGHFEEYTLPLVCPLVYRKRSLKYQQSAVDVIIQILNHYRVHATLYVQSTFLTAIGMLL
eukprot:gb/GECG01000082.1/.p1 GENE.gb/GECG01000082.1/~~gb/GECG01000082.1/.p1  ORF type:complete len:155 (+),score=8.83 gb/GECG01000082.1/:1-465(+)